MNARPPEPHSGALPGCATPRQDPSLAPSGVAAGPACGRRAARRSGRRPRRTNRPTATGSRGSIGQEVETSRPRRTNRRMRRLGGVSIGPGGRIVRRGEQNAAMHRRRPVERVVDGVLSAWGDSGSPGATARFAPGRRLSAWGDGRAVSPGANAGAPSLAATAGRESGRTGRSPGQRPRGLAAPAAAFEAFAAGRGPGPLLTGPRPPGRLPAAAAAAGQLDRAPLAEEDPDRRAVEAVRLADLVLEVALVAEMDAAGVLGEEDERGRGDGDLGGVEDLRPAALDQRRRLASDRLRDEPVQLAGRRSAGGARPRCRPRPRGPGRPAGRSWR